MSSSCCSCNGGCHSDTPRPKAWRHYLPEILSALMMLAGIIFRHLLTGWSAPLWFALAVLPVGIPVARSMWQAWRSGSFMNEYTLMFAATAGAFVIAEYPEAVAVLLFYSLGEKMESSAAADVRRRIKALIGRLPDSAWVKGPDGSLTAANPADVAPGTTLVVKPGERVPIDARLSGSTPVEFDTSAITGESVPRAYNPGDELPSGIIPVDRAVDAVTLRPFSDSSLSRIMAMIEDAQSGKSHTETMLRRITRWYTPLVFGLSVLLFVVPGIVAAVTGTAFDWSTWLERSLILLVCSCPCALVVSIPLSYFVSLGAASRAGLLFKGSRFVDGMRNVDTVVFDKTGTLTTGQFHVSAVTGAPNTLAVAAALDAESGHPLARAIVAEAAARGVAVPPCADVRSVPHGMTATIDGQEAAAGSRTLMQKLGVDVPPAPADADGTEICVAVGGQYLGAIYLQDTVKDEAVKAVAELHALGVKNVMILSGDREAAVARVAHQVGADSYRASLLPADKHTAVAAAASQGHTVAFAGDGVNDAPAIAAANVGIAMGTMGSDIAMESADVVIAGDNLLRIPAAIRLARRVRLTVAQNVAFAFGVKAAVMVLGALGVATLWAAVFADTGVTLLTVAWTLLRLRRPA